jgi:hypothetical protein
MRFLPWLVSVAALTLAPGALSANGYSHLEAGLYGHEDTDVTDAVPHRGNSLYGYRVAAQVAWPTGPWASFLEYGQTDVLEQFSGGLLYRRPVAPGLDLTGGASAEFEDMTDEKGYGLRAGLRWIPFAPLDVHAEVRHEELFSAATSARLTVAAQVARRWHVEGMVQAGDDERYLLGLRYALPGADAWLARNAENWRD